LIFIVGFLVLSAWFESKFEPVLFLGLDGGWVLGFLAEVGGLGLEDGG